MKQTNAKSELYHHGVKGMKWGVRRYQQKDGSLTPAGKKRYAAAKTKLADTAKSTKAKAAAKVKKMTSKESVARAAAKGVKVYSKYKTYELADEVFNGGAGKRAVKSAVKNTGRAVVTAYVMANGGHDIHWYDN